MQIAIRLEFGGQWTVDTERYKTLGKHWPENFLAHTTGHIDLQPCNQTRWHIIGNQPMHDRSNGISGARITLAFAEKNASTVHFRPLDHRPIHGQRYQPTLRWNPQDARSLIPLEAPGNAPCARGKLDARGIVVQNNFDATVIHHHLVGPIVHSAGQAYPLLFRIHCPSLGKARAGRIYR